MFSILKGTEMNKSFLSRQKARYKLVIMRREEPHLHFSKPARDRIKVVKSNYKYLAAGSDETTMRVGEKSFQLVSSSSSSFSFE
jgi:uncharacterized protein YaiE (UPF0345 family)